MKKIPLTRGMYAKVDDEDFERLSLYKWYAAKQPNNFYACRDIRIGGKKKCIWMHREINKTPDGLKTDHINGDGLDNRKCNLRSVSHADNMINNIRHSKNAPKYRGVSYHVRNMRWYAQITVDGKNIYIGSFENQEDARDAYEKKRKELRPGKIYKE